MGSSSSKFRKHLQSGDEVQALQLYTNNTDLQKGLDPNCSYGDSHQHETPLHYAARHGMRTLLRIFMYEKGGNPNKTNAKKETALHCVCVEKNSQYYNVQKRRVECLNMILNWRGATLQEGQVEKIDIGAQDEKMNTALHYAAASGLKECVEILVLRGAPLSIENADNWTPCESAEKSGYDKIARYLESKIVFSNDVETDTLPPIEEYCGLRAQDLQEAKDQLLVETADMLSVPLFTAEALLRNHEWSRETLLEAWMDDPVACCNKCGVTPPVSLFSDKPEVQESLASPLPSPSHISGALDEAECNVCMSVFLLAQEPVHMNCMHQFCRHCWERYLNMKIQEGDAHHITCPGYDCCMLVPVEVIESLVSRDMARRYLQFDIKAFVDSNPDMKWCPFPACGRAVKLPEVDGLPTSSSQTRMTIPSDTSRSVDCGAGHYFCWECLGEAHEPCSCENWVKWQQKISDIKPESLSGTEEETEMAANCLWLVTNSKSCPNCKSPIQKNEGCNHMKCSKCKYDFCWVCLEQWKRHNSSTGGYFKCNRYEVVKKVEEQAADLLSDAEEKNTKMQELNRFVHYYSRFKNHENSYKLEEPLLQTAKEKMMKLAEAVSDIATANAETQFVEDAVRQLLKARRVLKCSYVYAYYLDGPGYKKIVFEFMQTELEECTEILSQMVNRLYLRTPRTRIIEQAHSVQRRRLEFTAAIAKGLVPPETPPSVKKGRRRRKYSMESEDEDLRKAIMASIQEVDPGNPWIKDASGRHTNVMALLEWPVDDSEDSDSEVSVAALREFGKCRKAGCNRPKAVNPRSKQVHEYCSQRCKHHDEIENLPDDDSKGEIPEVILDEHMDLLRALEMSRLQYLRETGLLHEPDGQKKDGSSPHSQSKSSASSSSSMVARPRSNSSGTERKQLSAVGLTPMEELDIELQRVLELSSTILHSSQVETASGKSSSTEQTSKGARHKRKCSQSRFDETASTVVTRVPNKSVEDLYCLDSNTKVKAIQSQSSSSSSASATSEGRLESSFPVETPIIVADSPGTVSSFSRLSYGAGYQRPAESMVSRATGERAQQCSLDSCTSVSDHSTFGTIKDLSVSNIHARDEDKTSEFLSKNFHALFSGGKSKSSPLFSPAEASSTYAENPLSKSYKSEDGDDDDEEEEDDGLVFSQFTYTLPSVLSSLAAATSLQEDMFLDASLPPPPPPPPLPQNDDVSFDSALLPDPPASDPVPWPPTLLQKNSAGLSRSKRSKPKTGRSRSCGRMAVALQDSNFPVSARGASPKRRISDWKGSETAQSKVGPGVDNSLDRQHASLIEMAENLLQMTAEMQPQGGRMRSSSDFHMEGAACENSSDFSLSKLADWGRDQASCDIGVGDADTAPSTVAGLPDAKNCGSDMAAGIATVDSDVPARAAVAVSEEGLLQLPPPPSPPPVESCDKEKDEKEQVETKEEAITVRLVQSMTSLLSPDVEDGGKERPSFFV